jgi:hypothetical protein
MYTRLGGNGYRFPTIWQLTGETGKHVSLNYGAISKNDIAICEKRNEFEASARKFKKSWTISGASALNFSSLWSFVAADHVTQHPVAVPTALI